MHFEQIFTFPQQALNSHMKNEKIYDHYVKVRFTKNNSLPKRLVLVALMGINTALDLQNHTLNE